MATTTNGHVGLLEGVNQPFPITRAVVLGFYDGATDGVLQCGEKGPVYRFQLPTETHEGDVLTRGDRLFDLRSLPADALDQLVAVLAPYSSPKWPFWYVNWQFPTEQIEQEVNDRIERILSEAGPVAWRITTSDPWQFSIIRAEKPTMNQRA